MKKAAFKITLIGAGNLATQLGIALKAKRFEIAQVYSRTKASASLLAKKLKAEAIIDLSAINTSSDLYIIAVKDDVIKKLAKKLKLKDKLIVHTSGSIDSKVLKSCSENYGVIYPLQTLSKNKKISFVNIPLCIEASNADSLKKLREVAEKISSEVYEIDSQKRKTLHLAAVFASNFTNYMYSVSEKILSKEKIPFKILLSLIEETANKVQTVSPKKAQTGPAIRKDKKTMDSHLEMLKKDKRTRELYKLISKGILKNIS